MKDTITTAQRLDRTKKKGDKAKFILREIKRLKKEQDMNVDDEGLEFAVGGAIHNCLQHQIDHLETEYNNISPKKLVPVRGGGFFNRFVRVNK